MIRYDLHKRWKHLQAFKVRVVEIMVVNLIERREVVMWKKSTPYIVEGIGEPEGGRPKRMK